MSHDIVQRHTPTGKPGPPADDLALVGLGLVSPAPSDHEHDIGSFQASGTPTHAEAGADPQPGQRFVVSGTLFSKKLAEHVCSHALDALPGCEAARSFTGRDNSNVVKLDVDPTIYWANRVPHPPGAFFLHRNRFTDPVEQALIEEAILLESAALREGGPYDLDQAEKYRPAQWTLTKGTQDGLALPGVSGILSSSTVFEEFEEAEDSTIDVPLDISPSPEHYYTVLREAASQGLPVGDILRSTANMLDQVVGPLGPDRRHVTDALAQVALKSGEIEFHREELDGIVEEARSTGASWSDIGRATGITPQAAHRRWDAEARRKHSDYQRQAKKKPQTAPSD